MMCNEVERDGVRWNELARGRMSSFQNEQRSSALQFTIISNNSFETGTTSKTLYQRGKEHLNGFLKKDENNALFNKQNCS